MTTPLPACCSPFDDAWPFPVALPGTCLISTRFDPARLEPGDFARLGLAPAAGVAKRQAEHLAGRACAHQALHRLTGHGVAIGSDSDRVPCWPAGTLGSITHGKGWAGALVGHTPHWQALGLDVEYLIPLARADRLAAEIFSPGELAAYRAGDAQQRSLQATLAFSAKESLFKALFPLVRRRFWFHDAELIEQGGGLIRLRLLRELSLEWPAGRELCGQYARFDEHLLSVVAEPAA